MSKQATPPPPGDKPKPGGNAPPPPPAWRHWLLPIGIVVALFAWILLPAVHVPSPTSLSYSQFLTDVNAHKVKTVVIPQNGGTSTGTLTDKTLTGPEADGLGVLFSLCLLTSGDVGRPTDDLPRLGLARVDHAHAQTIGLGMAVRADHLTDDEVLERSNAVALNALHLGSGHGQSRGQLARIELRIAVRAQPGQRHPHLYLSRKRRSLS